MLPLALNPHFALIDPKMLCVVQGWQQLASSIDAQNQSHIKWHY